MIINQVQVGGNLYSLAEGQLLQLNVGDTIRVFYSLKYTMPEKAYVSIWASLYTGALFGRVEQAQTKSTITLEAASTQQTYDDQIDITIGNVSSGIYGLILELPGYDVEAKIDDCIEVTAAPGMMEWIGPLIMIAMMGMMAQMTTGMAKGME